MYVNVLHSENNELNWTELTNKDNKHKETVHGLHLFLFVRRMINIHPFTLVIIVITFPLIWKAEQKKLQLVWWQMKTHNGINILP